MSPTKPYFPTLGWIHSRSMPKYCPIIPASKNYLGSLLPLMCTLFPYFFLMEEGFYFPVWTVLNLMLVIVLALMKGGRENYFMEISFISVSTWFKLGHFKGKLLSSNKSVGAASAEIMSLVEFRNSDLSDLTIHIPHHIFQSSTLPLPKS